jgi:hypothetical protein
LNPTQTAGVEGFAFRNSVEKLFDTTSTLLPVAATEVYQASPTGSTMARTEEAMSRLVTKLGGQEPGPLLDWLEKTQEA